MPHLVLQAEASYISSMRAVHIIIATFVAALACGPRPMPAGYAKQDVLDFVQSHRAELETEARIGSGSTLRDLGTTAGCENLPELERRLHKDHDQIFTPSASDAEVAERVADTLSEHGELRCLDLELGREREFSAGLRHIGPTRSTTRQ